MAVFAIPAKFVASALEEVGRKGIPNAVLIPSGFAETGEHELQDEIVAIAERHGVRLLGPNIYGYYSTWQDLCATFCTPYDVKGGGGADLAVGRHRYGDPGFRADHEVRVCRRSSGSATSPTSTRTIC